MTDELEKQARAFENLAKEYLWGAYANAKDEFEEVAELVKLLAQVREQTVAECMKEACFCCDASIAQKFNLPAPPSTSQGQGE